MTRLEEISLDPARIFVVGDIHGCSETLSHLLTHLSVVEKVSNDDLLVFVGDYIDRGVDSKGVINQLLDVRRHFPETLFLKGNHEDMLLSYLGFRGNLGVAWLHNGGDKTLRSYGIKKAKAVEDVLDTLPPDHVQFLLGLSSYAMLGDYVFVHAGLSPIRPLPDQVDEDLLWIREEFIHNVHRFEKTIVFGHTPFQDVLFHLPYKIGIDTGLVFGNKLSCVELKERRILQIRARDKRIEETPFPAFTPVTTG